MLFPIFLLCLLLPATYSESAISLSTSSRSYTYNSTPILTRSYYSSFPTESDDISVPVDLPFPITFLNTQYNRLYVCSNSFVSFDAGFDSYSRLQLLPTNKILIKARDFILKYLRVFSTDSNVTIQF